MAPSTSHRFAHSETVLQLAFMRLEGGDLCVLISFPGAFGPMYPVSTYPKLTEFRAMLAALRPDGQRHWAGANFFGYVTGTAESADAGVWFRGPDNGITVGLSLAHWTGLRALFQQAWELPELLGASQRLVQDYGEL